MFLRTLRLISNNEDILLIVSLLTTCGLFSYVTTRNYKKTTQKRNDVEKFLKRMEKNYHAVFSQNGDFSYKQNGEKRY